MNGISILIRCLMDIHGGMSLKKDKIYEAVQGEHGLVQVVDESGEDYLYPYQIFEKVKGFSIVCNNNLMNMEVEKQGKGFWSKSTIVFDTRRKNYLSKIHDKNNSFYFLPYPNGGYIRFDNIINSTVQSIKLITNKNSIYFIENQPDFVKNMIILEAIREWEAANFAEYELEWIINNKEVVMQLENLFSKQNLKIKVKFLSE